jgi:lysine-ketoglutarate reductase/saccharopine dehydrogenase-like protein (TIGR00300 family)
MGDKGTKREIATGPLPFVEDVEVSGHIIDSLILPKILDAITAADGSFEIKRIAIGHARTDPSHALVEVQAASEEKLQEILDDILDHGAVPVNAHDCRLEAADMSGAFPEGFYSTTNQRTEVRIGGEWIPVDLQEMDCGIAVCLEEDCPEDDTGKHRGTSAWCVPMNDVHLGQKFVVGHAGVRVFPEQRAMTRQAFEFMNSSVSTEKPKGVAIRQTANELFKTKRDGGRTLLVGGPAIVHTGSVEHVAWMIRAGYIQLLFAGNALATHDIEQALFGTSLGVRLDRGDIVEAGHEHHLRAINRIRRWGGIEQAVAEGNLKSGIMYECVSAGIPFLLAGSIRDDGPLPEVVTDVLVAQERMRELARGINFCLMIATTLHSIAVGNLLPAWVKVVCVDINPSTVIKLADRGSFQTVGIVTDVEPFLRELVHELQALEAA